MRFLIAALLLFIASISYSQEMFMLPVKLSNNDSVSINVSEVYVAYEQSDGTAKLAYSYPNSTILLKTTFDDLIANSCGNLVAVSVVQPAGVQEIGINPQYTYRVYRASGRTKIQIRNTNQIFDSPQSFAEVSALLGNCGAASIVSIDSVTVANDTICFYYNDATFDCYELTDTTTTANWYTTNGSTTDSLRWATIIKTAIWYGADTTGFIRHQVGLLDGSRTTIYQDSVAIMKFGADATNYVSVGRGRINIVTSGDEGSIRLRSDTINFFDKYLFANATPLSTSGVMSFHYWLGNGTNTTPGFTTMSVLADSIDNYINITADNGITENVHNNFRLGGALVQTTTITPGAAYQLIIDGSIPTSTAKGTLRVNNTSAASLLDAAIYGVANAGRGVEGISTSGIGVLGTGPTGVYGTTTSGVAVNGTATGTGNAFFGSSQNNATLSLIRSASSTNSVLALGQFIRQTSSTAADGIGMSLDFNVETSTNSDEMTNQVISKWGTATHASRTSQLIFTGVDTTVTKNLATFNGGGSVALDQYGDNNFKGTVSKVAGWDANGKFLEMTMSELADSVSANSADINIYENDGLLKAGGTTVGLDSGSLKLELAIDAAATKYGIELIGSTATASNRWWSTRTEADSARFQEFANEYYLIVSTDLIFNVSDQERHVADSVQWNEGTVQTVDSTKFILGMTSSGWMKRFDSDTSGTVLYSVDGLWKQRALADLVASTSVNIYNTSSTIGTNRTASITDNLTFTNNSAAAGERFIVTYDNGVSSTNFFQVKEGTGIMFQSSENGIWLEGATMFNDVVSPSTLVSNTNNYTGLNGANFGRLSSSPSVNLTGIANGRPGRVLPMFNVGSSHITLVDNATSTALNRFEMQTNLNLKPNDGALFIYDSVTQRHRLLATSVGSLYTGSGQLLNGRSGSLYASYMADTLNDFALGYFTNGTSDDRITYGKFGIHIDGAAGFSVAGKETYTKGTLFNLLGTSYITANGYGYEMSGLSRVSSGSSSNTRVQFTGNTIFNQTSVTTFSENEISIDDVNDLYDDIVFGTQKQLDGVPRSRTDHGYLYQGGGHTGSDTSAISVWWGVPQYTDTVGAISTGGVRAISKDRGFGVQSIFNYTSGVAESFAYNWLKIKTGSVLADTAIHSSANDGITFYGNSYEIPNQTPSSAAGDTSVMVWTDRYNSFFIDKSEFCCGAGTGSGQNIYNTDDLLKAGGTTVGLDSGSLKLELATDAAATKYGIELIGSTATASNRWWSTRTEADSARFQEFANEYYLIVSTDLIFNVSDQLRVVADSVQFPDATLEGKTKIRSILGTTPGGWMKRFDGDATTSGDVLVGNGTDWQVGSLSAHESNVKSTIRPSQITATQNDYNPTGYSTTKSQTIQVDGDGSFRTITGLVAATRDGVEKTFDNDGTNCYVIAKQHTSSSAGNRFNIPKDVVMLPGMNATFRYDSVGAAWRLINTTDVYYGSIVDATTKNNTATVTSADNAEFNFSTNGGSYSSGGANSTIKTRFFQVSTASAATPFPTIQTKNGITYQAANNSYVRVAARIRIEDLSTATQDFDIRMGWEATVDTTISEGAMISYQREENSGGFTIKTHDGASPTTTNAGSAIAADTWYTLELIYYPYGEVTAFINGTRYTTTATLPEAITSNCYIQVDKDNGSSANLVYVTQFEVTGVNVSD